MISTDCILAHCSLETGVGSGEESFAVSEYVSQEQNVSADIMVQQIRFIVFLDDSFITDFR